MKKDLVLLDLFCGAGGFSSGFREAGFRIGAGVEINEDIGKTYKFNFPEATLINKDITQTSSEEILQMSNLKKEEVSVIIGGPPCQGYSHAGKRLVDDPRNILFKEFVRIVNDIRPKVFVMENVVGLVTMANGRYRDEIIQIFKEIGYNVEVRILNAANYGVPQQRMRTIFIGCIEGEVSFPPETHSKEGTGNLSKWVTVGEALFDLPRLGNGFGCEEMVYSPETTSLYQDYMRGYLSYEDWVQGIEPTTRESEHTVKNHMTSSNKESTREKISYIPQGGNWSNLPEELKTKGKFSNLYKRLYENEPSITLTNIRKSMIINPWENRLITVREGARIQSLPDSFVFKGSLSSQQQQIGNCVPALLACAIAKHIKNTYF